MAGGIAARDHRPSARLPVAVGCCLASFYVITRRVLAPIQGMSRPVLPTRGEFVAFEPAAGEPDEIDKLARVLHAFGGTARRSSAAPAAAAPRHGLEHSNQGVDDFAYMPRTTSRSAAAGSTNHSRFLLEDNQDKLDPESVKRLSRLVT